MSREIKFRVWCNYHKDWEKDEILLNTNGLVLHDGRPAPKDHVVMQFTGLLDKNGKEIYEGDIIKGIEGCLYEIIWDEKEYKTKGIVSKCPYSLISHKGKLNYEEVIGNIYENKELLETNEGVKG